MSENIQITEQETDRIIADLLSLHEEDITVDVNEFLDLLKHSLSLNTMEKKRVIDAAPTLSQFQFDELKKVFVEERSKFKDLAQQHPEDIKKLLSKQQTEWVQLGDIYKSEQENQAQQDEDQEKIDDIKANLWL